MTDTEIIKALECCVINNFEACTDCPVRSCSPKCVTRLQVDCLNLINRQKAEIETWKESFNNLDKIARPNLAFVETAKKQAVREFAEKLKESFNSLEYASSKTKRKTLNVDVVKSQMDWVLHEVTAKEIDDLVKEMVGDE